MLHEREARLVVTMPIASMVRRGRRGGRGVRQRVAAHDADGSHCHGDVRQGSTNQGSTGQGDGPSGGITREDVSFERRSRHGQAGARRPENVARLPATAHDHVQVGAGDGAIGEENPLPGREPSERQRASLSCRVEAVDAGRKLPARKRPSRLHAIRRGSERRVEARE